MNWVVNLLLSGVKKKAVEEAKKFRWSERERETLRASGVTEAEILASENANRVGLAAWVERQVK